MFSKMYQVNGKYVTGEITDKQFKLKAVQKIRMNKDELEGLIKELMIVKEKIEK